MAVSPSTTTTGRDHGRDLIAVQASSHPSGTPRRSEPCDDGQIPTTPKLGLWPNHSWTGGGSRPGARAQRPGRTASSDTLRMNRKIQAVEDQADQRSDDSTTSRERGEDRPVVTDGRLVVHGSGHERLGPEREVEHARGLVREDQAHRDEREHASERDATDDVADEVGHGVFPPAPELRSGGVGYSWENGLITVTLFVESGSFQQRNGLPFSLNVGTNFVPLIFVNAWQLSG